MFSKNVIIQVYTKMDTYTAWLVKSKKKTTQKKIPGQFALSFLFMKFNFKLFIFPPLKLYSFLVYIVDT